jgi:hypothetical protein
MSFACFSRLQLRTYLELEAVHKFLSGKVFQDSRFTISTTETDYHLPRLFHTPAQSPGAVVFTSYMKQLS